jgi:biotin carboxylase
MATAGLPVPRWRTAASPAEIAAVWDAFDRVPSIVKPAVGMGSLNTFALDPGTDVATVPIPPGEYIVEQRLIGRAMPHPRAGDYCSVETASSGGKHEPVAIVARMPLKAPFRESGVFLPAVLDDRERDEVMDAAVRALTACAMTDGISHTEIKLTAEGPRVIEVNGRLGGHMAHIVGHAIGRNLVRDAILCALGRPPDGPTERTGVSGTVYRKWFYAREDQGLLAAVEGLDGVRALPHVMSVKRLLPLGADINWTGGTATSVVQVDGRAADLDEADAVLDEAGRLLDIRVEP